MSILKTTDVRRALAHPPTRLMAANQARSECPEEWDAISERDREQWVDDIIRDWCRQWEQEIREQRHG